jgi:hypothetical protein
MKLIGGHRFWSAMLKAATNSSRNGSTYLITYAHILKKSRICVISLSVQAPIHRRVT